MADLSTTYMGLKLKHPIVPGASPLSKSIDGIKALEDAGIAAGEIEEQVPTEPRERPEDSGLHAPIIPGLRSRGKPDSEPSGRRQPFFFTPVPLTVVM